MILMQAEAGWISSPSISSDRLRGKAGQYCEEKEVENEGQAKDNGEGW